jgi:hypothetical protein
MSFKTWLIENNIFRYDASIPDQKLLQNIAYVRRDPRFAQYGDDQIEMMLHHHTPEEILSHGPEESLARYRDFSIGDAMSLGDLDF